MPGLQSTGNPLSPGAAAQLRSNPYVQREVLSNNHAEVFDRPE